MQTSSPWLWMAQQAAFAIPAALLMRAVHVSIAGPGKPPPPAAIEALRASWVALMTADVGDARAGMYPSSLLTLPTAQVLPRVPELLVELPRVVLRARRRQSKIAVTEDSTVPLPDYYRRAFHWQSDGWLSAKSARLYEPSVELLFAGAAAPMRRRALRPLVDAVRNMTHPRILDVACGAGGFLAQVGAALPHARLSGVDLSASYVAHARAALVGVDADINIENAESLPHKDGLFDAVSCVFLFHELPRDARRAVAREMFRVLKPGGTVVVVDAAQQHATPLLQPFLDFFEGAYHEPYFRSYQRDPIEEVLQEVGFQVTHTAPAFVSRVVVGQRP